MNVVVTGGAGTLATALRPYFPYALYATHADLDVSNANSVNRFFSTHSADLVLHLAAATAYNSPVEALLQTNVIGTANIARWALRSGARVLYTSTDYVFPGTKGMYVESDPVQPVGPYAASKLGGEAAMALLPNSLVVRGSWYTELAWERAATDAFTSREPVASAAGKIAALAQSTLTGVVHIAGRRRSFWELVATEFNPRCTPVSKSELRLPYALPADSSLSDGRYRDFARTH